MTTDTVPRPGKPDLDPDLKPKGPLERGLVATFVGVPFVALLAAISLAVHGGWLSWHDVVLGVIFYSITTLGVTMGFHRLFTHGSFKANRPLYIALAIAGSLAIEGPVLVWCADHRRHHKFSDKDGDPHSPWRYGEDWKALTKGLGFAHIAWMFDGGQPTNQEKFIPDLLANRDMKWISPLFPLWVAISLLLPPLMGGLWSMSIHGAITAFIWATLVRICLMHHVTWSINSICHTFGVQEFEVRDKSRNFWPLAILSFGESWHNTHHTDPTCARHGALKHQIDLTAEAIRFCENRGWAYDVHWPDEDRLASKRAPGRRARQFGRMAVSDKSQARRAA